LAARENRLGHEFLSPIGDLARARSKIAVPSKIIALQRGKSRKTGIL
jgi:hypothetical protein